MAPSKQATVVQDRISYRYALSVYELAIERDALEQVRADFQMLLKTIESSRDLLVFLNNPILSGLKKLPALRQIFQGKIHPATLSLIELLARKGREELIQSIAKAFLNIYRHRNNIRQVTVRSAERLTPSQLGRIQEALGRNLNAEVEIGTEVDPALIGGFVVDFGSQIFDGSVSYALHKVEKELLSQTQH